MKVLIVLCLVVIAVQAFPKQAASPALKDDFDDLLKEVDILDNIAQTEEQNATEVLADVLGNADKLKSELHENVIEDISRVVDIWIAQVHDLERQAEDYDVSIAECIGDQIEQITQNLPVSLLHGAGTCATNLVQEIVTTVSDALVNINLILPPIQEYLEQIQQCKDSDPTEQTTCVTDLSTKIKNDQIQVPVKIHLILDETLANIETQKTILPLCFDDSLGQYNKLSGDALAEITECAERLFPQSPITL